MWSMSTRDAEDALLALTRVRGQLDALLMRVLRQAEAVGAGLDTGATSTTNWWSHATRTTRAEAHRTARLARSMEDHEEVGRALVAGDVRTDQARVVTEAVDALPDVTEEGVPEAAIRVPAGQGPRARREGAPGPGPPRAGGGRPRCRRCGRGASAGGRGGGCPGCCVVHPGRRRAGVVPRPLHRPLTPRAMLAKDLKARVARTLGRAVDGDPGQLAPRYARHRMGLAFVDYIETRPRRSVPKAGGLSATVVVTMELETLSGGLKAASLDTGGRISAGEARRLACRAGIIPVVLGGPSVPLDVGRRRRFNTEAQRIGWGSATAAAPRTAATHRPP